MNKKIIFGRSLKDIVLAIGPLTLLFVAALIAAYFFLDPAPPTHLVIAAGSNQGDYRIYAKLYQDFLKQEGVDLTIRSTSGPEENLRLLQDDNAHVDIAFMQDGIGNPQQQPDLVSFGSLYQEPIWIFYRAGHEMTKLAQLQGKRIAIGPETSGTNILARTLLDESGVNTQNTTFINIGLEEAAQSLRDGGVDAALFLSSADDPLIDSLATDPKLSLMDVQQAEAISRQNPYLHHLVLPQGAFDLRHSIPDHDVNLVSPTATLIARDDLHPALIFLLLKAATEVHNAPGMFEKKDEFPSDQASTFPIDRDAKAFYKTGTPFWQRHLPYWLASLVDRFIIIVIPILALALPLIRLVPKIYQWRVRSRIFKRYGELKDLETQVKPDSLSTEFTSILGQLDDIEARVNAMRVPLDYSDHIYVLREHIDFVRGRIRRLLHERGKGAGDHGHAETPRT